MRLIKHKKNGFTLVELLVSVAIGGGALYFLGKSLNQLNAGSKKIDAVSGISDIKDAVLGYTSCENTFASHPSRPACSNPGTYIDILGEASSGFPAGKPIIESGGSKFGDWTVRALCTRDGVDIRASMILDEFISESTTLMNWRGASRPSARDLKKFRKDYISDSANRRYSWDHPLTTISSPGLMGLCHEYFSTTANPVVGCNGNQYLKQINLTDGTFVCKDIPNCSNTDVLKFNGTDLICSPELYNQVATEITNYKNPKIGPLESYSNTTITNIYNRAVTIYNTLFLVFNPANDFVITKDSRAECMKRATMQCPSGWVMTSYEFRYDTNSSQNCSMNCRKVGP